MSPSIFDNTGKPTNRSGKANISMLATMNAAPSAKVDAIVQIPIDKLDDMPDNEEVFGYKDEDIQAIADEIKSNGFHGSIEVVRSQDGSGRYTIVSGHQRKRALEMTGAKEVPCHVLKDMSELQIRDLWRSENTLHRKQTPYRYALLVKSYDEDYAKYDLRGGKTNYCAEKLHVGATQVKRYRTLLSFPKDVAERCDSEAFPYTTLLQAKDFDDRQKSLLSAALRQRDIDHPNYCLTSEDLRRIIDQVREDSKYDDSEVDEKYEVHSGESSDGVKEYTKAQTATYKQYYQEISDQADDRKIEIIDQKLQDLVDQMYALINDGRFLTGNRISINKSIYGLERIVKALKAKDGY